MTDHNEKKWAAKRKTMDYYFVSREGSYFNHCFVMVVYPGGGLRIESLWARLDVEPYSELEAVVALEAFVAIGWTVEKVKVGDIPMPRLPGLGTCVSLTKRVLGINKPWILTTKQLARCIDGNIRREESFKAGREVDKGKHQEPQEVF